MGELETKFLRLRPLPRADGPAAKASPTAETARQLEVTYMFHRVLFRDRLSIAVEAAYISFTY